MSGYSGTPLAKKLGIKPGALVGAFSPPHYLSAVLAPLPTGVTMLTGPDRACDVLLVFATELAAIRRDLQKAIQLLRAKGGLWLCWPKKSSGIETDLAFEPVQRLGLDSGLVDNKVCAVDETWSGLRFVVRQENRADWPR